MQKTSKHFFRTKVRGLEAGDLDPARLSEFIAELAGALREKKHHILLPRPTSLTLTSGISDKGDRWDFEIIAPFTSRPVTSNPVTSNPVTSNTATSHTGLDVPRFYTHTRNGTVYHLADHRIRMPLFSAALERRNGASGSRKDSLVACLPMQLCRVFSKVYKNEGPDLDLHIEDFSCKMLGILLSDLQAKPYRDIYMAPVRGMELIH